MEWMKEDIIFTDDKTRIDVEAVFNMLSGSYWASERSRQVMEKSFSSSLCFSLLKGNKQIGFLRVVTDYATFAWVCDVIVNEEYRGHGLGKWMMDCMLAHPDLQQVNMALGTKDAHGLYEQYGFERKELMRRKAN
jgi:GNAT superfamily N-acetyltransferase